MGTSQQKAMIVREIIQNYGVDIQTLDQVLAGQPINPQQATVGQHNTPPQWAAPIFQFMNHLQTQTRNRQQNIEQEAVTATETFAADPKHEFFEDVRQDMADIMELAARRGKEVTMDQAYARACQDNPEIKAVLDQRTRAAAASGGQSAVARARAAASTVTGNPRAGGAPANPQTRRDEIAAAWDEIGTRGQ